jgi:hypothetical protein
MVIEPNATKTGEAVHADYASHCPSGLGFAAFQGKNAAAAADSQQRVLTRWSHHPYWESLRHWHFQTVALVAFEDVIAILRIPPFLDSGQKPRAPTVILY